MYPMTQPRLELRDVHTHFPVRVGPPFATKKATVRAVDGVSLSIAPGEILGLVGESGCGKSTLARTIMQLEPPTSGAILLDGQPVRARNRAERLALARSMQMVFQDPYASLNPRMTVGDTLAEPLRTHQLLPNREIPGRVRTLLETVGLSAKFIRKYPHEFSGGQRQRIAIARALALEPRLILADEPVSALDVSVQAQILNLLSDLRAEMGLTMLFISHDLSVVRHIADRIAVMYLGKVVETGPAEAVFHAPLHPYTRALVSSIPTPNPVAERERARMPLKGELPSPLNPPKGCPFHPRCPDAIAPCRDGVPPLESHGGGRTAACIRVGEHEGAA